jgi:hypothetical protein
MFYYNITKVGLQMFLLFSENRPENPRKTGAAKTVETLKTFGYTWNKCRRLRQEEQIDPWEI